MGSGSWIGNHVLIRKGKRHGIWWYLGDNMVSRSNKRELKKMEVKTKPRSAGDRETGGGPAGVMVAVGAAVLAWWRGSWWRLERFLVEWWVPVVALEQGHVEPWRSRSGRW
jgi:hypothetical protein